MADTETIDIGRSAKSANEISTTSVSCSGILEL